VVTEVVSGDGVRVHATLPIFRLSAGSEVVFYAPGRAVRVPPALAGQVEAAVTSGTGCEAPLAEALARDIEGYGLAAEKAWRELARRPFEPECLTLILSNRCDLACRYCYAARGRNGAAPALSEPSAERAAQLVAHHCAAASKPLAVVFHGGGEPTLEWELLVRLRAMVGRIAAEHGVPARTHVATHGAIDESRARWLAEHIDHVGLSCDGPPDIQDAQRGSPTGATSVLVERTAHILRESGSAFTVRVTVTPATVDRQEEILEYARQRLRARSVRVEPVYRGHGAGGPHFCPDDAGRFVEHYVRAAEAAKAHGCEVQTSGARPGEIHGPYCNPLRGVVQVGPSGFASACFLDAGDHAPRAAHLVVACADPRSGEVEIDSPRTEALRRKAVAVPEHCLGCVNVYHCTRGCPDVCPAETAGTAGIDGFRCRVQRGLAGWRIWEMAGGPIHS
jgi:uncharacterized protein